MSAKPPKTPPTPRERTQNFLLYGFALSILIHLLIGPLVQFKRTPEAPEKIETVRVDKMPTPPPTPKPTPPPTPTPPPKETPPPQQTPQPQQPKIKIQTLQTHSHTGGPSEEGNTHTSGSENGVPQGTSTAPAATAAPVPVATPAPPTPSPTPTPPTCAVPNADARTVNAAQPETPAIAQQQGITGEVVVQVSLDETSHLTAEKIVKSPSSILNNAALNAAKQSTFKTRIQNCQPVADTYLFVVDFQSQ